MRDVEIEENQGMKEIKQTCTPKKIILIIRNRWLFISLDVSFRELSVEVIVQPTNGNILAVDMWHDVGSEKQTSLPAIQAHV